MKITAPAWMLLFTANPVLAHEVAALSQNMFHELLHLPPMLLPSILIVAAASYSLFKR